MNQLILSVGAVILVVAPVGAVQGPGSGSEPPRVTIDSGPMVGQWVDAESSLAAFRGIPFAAPPVGELRWRPPEDVELWKEERQATSYGPECPQPQGMMAWWVGMITTTLGGDPTQLPAEGQRDEDCLHLNVWSTNLGGSQKQPVMVWIHGGGLLMGTGSSAVYGGGSLARRGVVVVTINYRLGTLGFLAHPELTAESPHQSSGNYGFLDQIAALKWVRRNIGSFGGDPQNVTIFGESAGANSVLHLMTSPLAEGLFHRAITQSFIEPWIHADKPQTRAFGGRLDLAAAELLGKDLARRAGIESTESEIEALRKLPAEEIVGASPVEEGTSFYVPVVDTWVLPQPPLEIFRQGRQHDVPLMIGVTGNEGSTLLFEPPCSSVAEYEQFVRGEFGARAETLLAMYTPVSPEDCRPTRLRWFEDACMTAARYLAGAMERVESPAYLYLFSRVPPGQGGEILGAYHFSEVPFVFDTHFPHAWPTAPGDEALTEKMGEYWTRFAVAGNPNGNGLPTWSPYTRTNERYMDLDHVSVERTLEPTRVEILDRFEELFWNRKTGGGGDE